MLPTASPSNVVSGPAPLSCSIRYFTCCCEHKTIIGATLSARDDSAVEVVLGVTSNAARYGESIDESIEAALCGLAAVHEPEAYILCSIYVIILVQDI